MNNNLTYLHVPCLTISSLVETNVKGNVFMLLLGGIASSKTTYPIGLLQQLVM